MRPDNNRSLDWEEITLNAASMRGSFKLDQHTAARLRIPRQMLCGGKQVHIGAPAASRCASATPRVVRIV